MNIHTEVDEIYIATDWDIEGELIGYHALKYCCSKTKAKRMRFSSLTKNEIVKAFENPDEIDYGLVDAGESRHIIDWYYGINLSRALMNAIKAVNRWKTMSVGRVQGPALAFLTERELEIKKFVPKPYWVIEALLKDNLRKKYNNKRFKDEIEFFLYLYQYVNWDDKKKFLSEDFILSLKDDDLLNGIFYKEFEKIKKLDNYRKFMWIFEKIHIVGLLHRVDTTTMATSVEARVPFVDHKLVEFSMQIPVKYKLKWKSDLHKCISSLGQIHKC